MQPLKMTPFLNDATEDNLIRKIIYLIRKIKYKKQFQNNVSVLAFLGDSVMLNYICFFSINLLILHKN